MKVLVLTHKPPFPRIDGGCMATAQLISGLQQEGIDYKLALIHTQKHPFTETAFPEEIKSRIVLTHFIKTDGLKVNIKALKNSQHSIFTARFFDPKFADELITYCEKEQPDIIHFESLFAAVYFDVLKAKITAKYVLRTHNVEHQLWQDRAASSNFLKRAALKNQIFKLKKEEILAFKKMDGLVAIAKNEMNFIAAEQIKTKALWMPTGVQQSNMTSSFGNDFFHLGAMDWAPNRKAVRWLIDSVWSHYPEKNQNMLHLAGKGLLEDEFNESGVKNHGTVASSQTFMCEHGIMLVPLFEGSGLRIKIIEAGALGIPIIATGKAVEGIGLISGEHYFEANTAEAFTGAMLLLSNDVSLRRKIGEALQEFVQSNFNQNELNSKLIDFYRGI
jgi:glycosyltransferase involved in cell wall biosynthesis